MTIMELEKARETAYEYYSVMQKRASDAYALWAQASKAVDEAIFVRDNEQRIRESIHAELAQTPDSEGRV